MELVWNGFRASFLHRCIGQKSNAGGRSAPDGPETCSECCPTLRNGLRSCYNQPLTPCIKSCPNPEPTRTTNKEPSTQSRAMQENTVQLPKNFRRPCLPKLWRCLAMGSRRRSSRSTPWAQPGGEAACFHAWGMPTGVGSGASCSITRVCKKSALS